MDNAKIEFLKMHNVSSVMFADEPIVRYSADKDVDKDFLIVDDLAQILILATTDDFEELTNKDKIGLIYSSDEVTIKQICLYPELEELIIRIDSDQTIKLLNEIAQNNNLTSLVVLNELSSIPSAINNLTKLLSLTISLVANQISSLREVISNLPNLKHLNLTISFNDLTSLPNELLQLAKLTSLNLSYNDLTTLPNELWRLPNLISLNLSNNQFTKLPDGLWRLPNLVSLNLSNNRLNTLPAEIWGMTNLTSLNLSDTQITSLPSEIGQLINLTSIDISNNKLASLPSEIGRLKYLRVLKVEGDWQKKERQTLSHLPEAIGQLTDLTLLNIANNQLATLPTEIGQLTKLTTLDLSSNHLTSLPAEIGQLTKLTTLDLSSNHLTSLPAEIGQLTNLTALGLSSNHLTSLPAEIGQLTKLTALHLFGTGISILPAEIGYLINLETLDLYDTPLLNLPPEIGRLAKLTELNFYEPKFVNLPPEIGGLVNLKSLMIYRGQLSELPAEIGQLSSLESLSISKTQLSSLPLEIGQLKNLKSLSLEKNKIDNIPSEICQLKNLTWLDLSENQLTKLPSELGKLTNLTRLDLSKNQLIKLPNELGDIKNLTSLNLYSNKLTILPITIGQLTNLASLDFGYNSLIILPADIGQLTNLTSLDLFANKLGSIPPEIGQLVNLTSLNLDGNQIKVLPRELTKLINLTELFLRNNKLDYPPEILDNVYEPQSILNYLHWILDGKKKFLGETKMLVIGEGSVGKTSIVKRLLFDVYDSQETKTEGIAIDRWQVDNQTKNEHQQSKISLNVWDFGGQKIMQATHQFFFTTRSLYLLVLDNRQTPEGNNIDYWLKIIEVFGGESPVLVVGNKIDQHPLDIDRTGLQKKYPNIVGILETSAATGAGIEELKAAIAEQVNNLPHVRDLLPETWFTVKTKLEELGREFNYITHDDFIKMCVDNEVNDEISQRTLIGLLHVLGVVLHFQDDPRLEALGILNPQWVTNGVYKILNSHTLFQNKGVLTTSMLDEILNLPEYPRGKRLFIVDMMKKFELCYDIEADKTFLVPDLLPKDEPFTGEWDGALAFQYHYNVLPSSIISRFIVRMNAFVHKTVWRSGVVLKSGGNTALVKADTEDRKIYIWATGDENTRRDFLSAIRMEFDAIHKTIAKIEATEKVPLPKYPNADPVDYRLLLQLEQKGIAIHHVQAGSDLIEVIVRELLDGVRPSQNQVVKVFISYAHKDKTFAKKLAGELEGQGMKVWWDFDSLKGGQDWQKEIERGIKQCNFFLVALTPDAVASDWVGNEITYATLAQKTILPLHLKKCDIPISLIKKQYIDFEKQTQKSAIKELLGILKPNNP